MNAAHMRAYSLSGSSPIITPNAVQIPFPPRKCSMPGNKCPSTGPTIGRNSCHPVSPRKVYAMKTGKNPFKISKPAQKNAKGLELHLYVFYDGNNENPAYLSEDSLKTQEAVYSVPLKPMVETGEYTSLHITFYEMDSSTKKIEKNTYRLSSAL